MNEQGEFQIFSLKEYTDLVTFIEITGLEGADAILNAIQSNVASLETFFLECLC